MGVIVIVCMWAQIEALWKEMTQVKVILQQDVKGHGRRGEMKEVSDGYARNYLLPRGLAVAATADNMNAMKLQEKAKIKQTENEKKAAKETAEALKGILVTISAKAGSSNKLFGSVTTKEISEELQASHGITIEKNKIIQAEPIKTFGSYELKVKLGHEITGTLSVAVIEG